MAKTALLQVKTDPKVKSECVKLFENLGITISDAVNIFLRQSLIHDGLPFEVKQSSLNKTTIKALEETEDIVKNPQNYKSYSDVDEMIKEITA